MPYNYQPVFGVEPYAARGVPVSDEFGGGATLTGQNLLLALWTVEELSPNPAQLPIGGQLVKPFANTAAGKALIDSYTAQGINMARGLLPAFNSSYACQLTIDNEDGDLSSFVLGVLQPPKDLVNEMLLFARNIKPAANILDASFSLAKSLMYPDAWSARAVDQERIELELSMFFGGISRAVFFGEEDFGIMPFLRTPGLDGTYPQFFASVADMLRAVTTTGVFYVPCLFPSTGRDSFVNVTLSWPFTTGRR